MRVLYTGSFRYPDKDAAGKRVDNITNCLLLLNDVTSIFVAGWEKDESAKIKSKSKVTHQSFSILDKKINSRIMKIFNFAFLGCSLVKWFYYRREHFDIVILYNPPAIFSVLMLVLGKFLKKKVILDSTEWYESDHLTGGRFSLAAFENYLRMCVIYPRFNNVIAISKYLKNYYITRGVPNVIRVPPLAMSNLNLFMAGKNNIDSSLNLLYAGSPGQKDRIDELVYKILNTKNGHVSNVKLHIAGITEEQFFNAKKELMKFDNQIKNFVQFYGRIPMNDVLELYKKCDYCIFIRDNKRYALAGFPSKVVEALSMNTPIITNPVGDVCEILPEIGISLNLKKENIDDELQIAVNKKGTFSNSISRVLDEKFTVAASKDLIEAFIRKAI